MRTFLSLLLIGTISTSPTMSLSGTATHEAEKPYAAYHVRLRDMQTGTLQIEQALDNAGRFTLVNLPAAPYVVELVNPKGRVVCTEGPFSTSQTNIQIDCGNIAAWWLLGAAAAAGITAGVVTAPVASPSR